MITLSKAVVRDDYTAFPAGVYVATLDRCEDREFGEQGSEDWAFILQLFFRDLKPANEGMEDVGARPFRGDIRFADRGVSLADVTDGDVGNLAFPLERGLHLLGQIQLAASADDDEVKDVSYDPSAIADALRSGEFDGQEYVIQVSHWGTDPVKDQLAKIAAA